MTNTIYQKLGNIQRDLKATKGQRNTFGNYNYRSCEDILEAVKPLLTTNNASLVMFDDVKNIGDRYYIEAIAKLIDNESGESVEGKAFAREPLSQKGQNEAQITGSASSYARKYALNGLFAIDDSKDADTNEHHNNSLRSTNVNKPDYRKEIFNLLESGKVPETDKQNYISQFKANSSMLNADTVAQIKAKYFNA